MEKSAPPPAATEFFKSSAAQVRPHGGRISLRNLDLSRPPGENELIAAGQLGSPLTPSRSADPEKQTTNEAKAKQHRDNHLFGQAMQKWNEHRYDEAVQVFRQHRAEFADSPWAGEAQLHLGCQAQFSGNWNSARESFEAILTTHKKGDDIWQKAKLRRAVLHFQQAELNASTDAFAEMLKTETSWERRTYAQTLLRQVNQTKGHLAALKVCGPECLAYVLRAGGDVPQAGAVLSGPAPSDLGYSLGQLANLAIEAGLTTTAVAVPGAALRTMPVPFVAHYKDRHFVVVTGFTESGGCLVFDPRLGRITELEPTQFAAQWSGKAIVFGQIPAEARLASVEELSTEAGGCCGLPRYPDDLGNECPMHCNGLPVWQVNPINMNLVVQDVPIWHQSAIGPDFEVRITYNSEDSLNQLRPFGNKWVSNLSSYLVESPAQGGPGEVLVVMPNGRGYTFSPVIGGGYTQTPDNFNTLTKTGAYAFDMKLPDGSTYRYGPPAAGSTSSLLLAIIDRHSLPLTIAYDASGQIDFVQDADGSVFDFQYDSAGHVSRVLDPWGRFATFSYNASGDLIGQRDMGGLVYGYTYDADKYLTSVAKPSGTHLFYIEPAQDSVDNGTIIYPAPGGKMWSNYRITITDPLGYKEEYYYEGYHRIGWHRDRRQYLSTLPIGSAPKTNYYFAQIGGSTGKGVLISTHFEDGTAISWSNFNSSRLPQRVQDERNMEDIFTYNSQGRTLTHKDDRQNVRTYTYENGTELKTVTDPWSHLTTELNYVPATRDLQQIVQHLSATQSRTTSLSYNALGQLESVTDAGGHLFTLEYYAANDPVSPRRLKTTHRGTLTGAALGLLTYDAKGRVQTSTDTDSFTLTFTHDDLDRVTDVTYPDATSEHTDWGCCVVRHTRDRLGQATDYGYDPLNRLIRQRDARGVEVQWRYDPNGNRVKLTDGARQVTRWSYDSRNRVEKKTYAGGKTDVFTYTGDVLWKHTNGRGQTVTFGTDNAGNRSGVFAPGVPDTTFTSDKMNRLETMTDSNGATTWTRNWAGEVTDVTVVWNQPQWTDIFHYDYDALGRRTGRTVNGAAETAIIDDLGRATSLTNPLGSFSLTYQSAISGHLDTVAMAGGPSTAYGWHPSAQDQRLREIWNKAPGGATLSKFNCEYNSAGQIQSWRREGLSAGEATEYSFNYDPAGQLLDAVLRGVTSQTAVQSYGYGYDAAGNRTKEMVGTALTAETPDAQGLNQLATRGSGTVLPIRGTTNEPVSAVTVNAQAAKITGGNRFEGSANVTAGNNTVTVAATDYGQPPNTATKQYQVAVAAGVSDSLSYDDSGNTLTGAGRTYEWDSLDRMTAVTAGAQRTEFLYDGLGRRRKITEKTNGTVTSMKRLAYDGLDVAEERVDATNVLTKRFFGTGMQVLTGADAGRYIYTRDHLGSIREAWKVESTSVAVRYDYDPYGRRTKLAGGAFDTDFGFTGHYTHAATGLVLAHYRPYEPNLARWLSRDPIGEEGGLNLYGYVANDPVNAVDPLGLDDLNFFKSNDPSGEYVDFGKPYPRHYTVAGHGNRGVAVGMNGENLTVDEIYRIMKDNNYKDGTPVMLTICHSGATNKDTNINIARDLSKLTNGEVTGATGLVKRVYQEKTLTQGYKLGNVYERGTGPITYDKGNVKK